MQGINCAIIDKYGNYAISGSNDNSIRIWNIKEKICKRIILGHNECVISITRTANNKYIISCSISEIRVWNLN